MTTEVEAAQDLYVRLKPEALHKSREYVLQRTPAYLQEEMPGIIDADLANAASGAVVPSIVDRPYVSQLGDVLSCTLGNWNGTPTSRTYQWKRDNVDVGTNSATFTITRASDVGHAFFCSQTATNGAGTSAATASNVVVAV